MRGLDAVLSGTLISHWRPQDCCYQITWGLCPKDKKFLKRHQHINEMWPAVCKGQSTHRAATGFLISTGSYPKTAQEMWVLQKPCCIYRPSTLGDVGFLSVYCEYHWWIKKKLFIGQNLGRRGKLNWMLGESRQSQGEVMELLPETNMLEPCW